MDARNLPSLRRRREPRRHVRATYPFVRIHTGTVARADSRLAYGFVAGTRHLRDDAHAPRHVRRLLRRAVSPAAGQSSTRDSRSAPAGSRSRCTSRSPTRIGSKRRSASSDASGCAINSTCRTSKSMDDGIANGTYEVALGPAACRLRSSPRRASTIRCIGCVTTRARRRSISRISCSSPTTSSTSTSSSASDAS